MIYYSVDKRLPKFEKKVVLENIFILWYSTIDYYGIIKGQMGYSAECFI